MKVYYNEIDPFACDWLRELMKAGEIPDGDIDSRSIVDVKADEVKGYDQTHLFAGLGGWCLALKLAGWGERPVLSGSCPCPPFSSAGKGQRCPDCEGRDVIPHTFKTGVFVCVNPECEREYYADGRHLWPEMRRIIEECRPTVCVGEQVASDDGRVWLSGVRASLETLGYGVGCTDLCAAGIGSPHIRQRLFWVANTEYGRQTEQESGAKSRSQGGGSAGGMAHPGCERIRVQGCGSLGGEAEGVQGEDGERERVRSHSGASGTSTCGLANTDGGISSDRRVQPSGQHRQRTEAAGTCGRLGDTNGYGRGQGGLSSAGRNEADSGWSPAQCGDGGTPDTILDFWADSEWIYCRDGKYRRIPRQPQSGVQSLLSDGVPGDVADLRDNGGDQEKKEAQEIVRKIGTHPLTKEKIVGRADILRGAGNAIIPALAAIFIISFMDSEGEF